MTSAASLKLKRTATNVTVSNAVFITVLRMRTTSDQRLTLVLTFNAHHRCFAPSSNLYSKLAKSEPDCWITLFGIGGYFAAASARRAVSSAHRSWVFETTFTLWRRP